jgi:hypothetical protein
MAWFRKKRLTLDEALRQLIRGVLSKDTDLAGFPTDGLSDAELNVVLANARPYILSMSFRQLIERTELAEEDLEERFEPAGTLAYQDLGFSSPAAQANVLMGTKDYYLHDLPKKLQDKAASAEPDQGLESDREATKETNGLDTSTLYHQGFAHLCVPHYNPKDPEQKRVFDICVNIAREAEKRVQDDLDSMFKDLKITA